MGLLSPARTEIILPMLRQAYVIRTERVEIVWESIQGCLADKTQTGAQNLQESQ